MKFARTHLPFSPKTEKSLYIYSIRVIKLCEKFIEYSPKLIFEREICDKVGKKQHSTGS